jgi:hypothetical protein
MGRHVWDNAQHADALGRRLPELRAHAQQSEPAGEGFIAFMDALESPETPELTVERLVGMYRVLKPTSSPPTSAILPAPMRCTSRPRAASSRAARRTSAATSWRVSACSRIS